MATFKQLSVIILIFFNIVTLAVGASVIHKSRSHMRRTFQKPNNETVTFSFEEESIELQEREEEGEINLDTLGNMTWVFSQNSTEFDPGNNEHDVLYQPISVTNCGSPEVSLKRFSISPCQGDPCVVRRGSDITISATFVSKVKATRLSCDILAKWAFVKKHLSCPQSDACKTPGISCPLEIGKEYTYTAKQRIGSRVPKFNYWLQGTLTDQNGHRFLCIGTHAKIR